MDYLSYLPKFRERINRSHPDMKQRTIKVYLDAFAVLPPPLVKPEKSDAVAKTFRITGNEHFCCSRYNDAAMSYTVSLMHAPPDSESAAIAMANRSAALFRLELYRDCITDIDRALQLPYPTHSINKVISRREAAVTKMSDDSSMTNNKSNSVKIDSANNKKDLQYAHGDNAILPGASAGIKIKCGSKKQRKLVAEKVFRAGEIILMEKPYLIVPKLNENPTFCYHCLKETLCLISCNRCNKQIYCSEECRSEAFLIYHRTECPILNTLIAGNLVNSRSRIRQLRCLIIFTKHGMDFDEFWLEGIEKNSSDPAQLGFTGEKFIGHTRQAFLSLPTENSSKKQKMLFEAAYSVTLLKNYTGFFKNNVDIPIAAKMLIKLNNIYASNHFEILYVERSRQKASAAYPLVSLATHACISNTIAYTDANGKFILRASNYIKPGDEILYNYCELAIEFEKEKRDAKSHLCKRQCLRCDKTWLHTTEKRISTYIDVGLRDKLLENPYDIEALWELKMFLYGQGERYKLQVQVIKLALVDAYRGFNDPKKGCEMYRRLGIL